MTAGDILGWHSLPSRPMLPSVAPQVLAMPSLSPTMNAGNILGWRKAVGDEVAAGDILAEVETDKVSCQAAMGTVRSAGWTVELRGLAGRCVPLLLPGPLG